MERKRERDNNDEQPQSTHASNPPKKRRPAMGLRKPKKPPTVVSTDDPLKQSSSSSMPTAAGKAQGEAQSPSSSPGPSQPQVPTKPTERSKGKNVIRPPLKPSPARVNRPDPDKPVFDISQTSRLQAKAAQVLGSQQWSQSRDSPQEISGSSQDRQATPSSSKAATSGPQPHQETSHKLPFEISGSVPPMSLPEGQIAPAAFQQAFNGLKSCYFNESFTNCKRALSTYKLQATQSAVSDLLNGSSSHKLKMTANNDHITPVGYMLLFCLCQVLEIQAFVFSTRKQPIAVSPINGSSKYSMALLVHTDSYLQKTTWFTLEHKADLTPYPFKHQDARDNPSVVATIRQADAPKPKAEGVTVAKSWDDRIVAVLKKLTFPIFRKQWTEHKAKAKAKKGQDPLATFELKPKSFPQGVVAKAQDDIGSLMRGEGETPPTAVNWLATTLNRMKTPSKKALKAGAKARHVLEELVKEFKELIKKETQAATTSPSAGPSTTSTVAGPSKTSSSVDSPKTSSSAGPSRPTAAAGLPTPSKSSGPSTTVTGQSSSRDKGKGRANDPTPPAEVPTTDDNQDESNFRIISRGLKTVINGQLDYGEFLARLQALQTTTHEAMVGLCHCLGILQEAILNGSLSDAASTLDLELLDLDGHGIFQGVDPIFFMDNLDELVPSYFSFHGFYRVLCAAVGNIHPEKHSDKVMDLITEQLPQDMRVDFKTGYTLQASCRQLFTNFSNMWSQSKCRADLRVVLDLLLRMHLAQDRFFGPKKQRKKEVTADKTKTPRVHLKPHMDTLFWSIQRGKRADVINHWSEVLFEQSKKRLAKRRQVSQQTHAVEESHAVEEKDVSGDGDGDVDVDDQDIDQEEEEKEEDVAAAQSSRDPRNITAKEIKALVSVSLMLCQSPTIVGQVDAAYIKKQLYTDKQKSIPNGSLEICAQIVNGLKDLVPKAEDPFQPFQWFSIRQLRNAIVKFADNKTKLNEIAMHPTKKPTTWDYDAIRVDSSTLYYMYQEDHNLTKEDGKTLFTSGASIKSEADKRALFGNFFRCQYLVHIFKQQKLEFQFKFLFNSQYDLQFLGAGRTSKAQEQAQTVSRKLEPATDQDKQLANTLADHLNATKVELASVSKKLTVLEAQRRDAARLSRAHEKIHKSLDPSLYGHLKEIRGQCNALYLDQQRLQHSKSQGQSELYMLNKKISGQAIVVSKPIPAPPSFGPKTKIQGVDPGVVTMASGICSDQKLLFASINRYEALQDTQDTVHHGMDEDVAFEMTAKVVNAAVDTKTSPTDSTKKKQKKRVKSKCRLRRFYGKHCSQHRQQMGSNSFITFTGSWHGASTFIKGHNRRSTKPYYGRLAAHGQDQVITTNEFASTVTCNSCFCRTKKQSQRLSNGKMATIKGAVVCVNPRCPRRLTCNATTINRDENGARNIALIGFSTMVSRDGCTLPPFRPSYNPDKYNLSPKFDAYQIGDATNPSQGGDQFRVPRGL